jgi:peptidoglycan/LPS O-acetylase OafA/YrhL
MPQTPTARHSTLEYRPEIDGLRALAVLSVFVFHLNHKWLPGGFVGVDVFFVISGYLITSIIFKEHQKDSFSLRRFYQRRIARIFPVFFTVGLVTLVAAYLIYAPHDLAGAGYAFAAASMSVANMALMLEENYFVKSSDAEPFLHYWSLSVEEQFYIFFPLLLLLLFKYARKHLVLALAVLCAGSFLTSVIMTQRNPVWAFYLLPTRAWELLSGCLLGVTTDQAARAPEARWSKWLSVFCLGLTALAFFLIHESNHFPGYWALLPVVGAVGVLMPVRGGLSEKWLAAAPLVAVGRISYSLYLWHWPVFSLVDYKMYFVSEAARLTLKIGLSFFLAMLSFRFIENPARLFLNHRKNIRLAYASMFCAVAFFAVLGISIQSHNYVNAKVRDVAGGGLIFGSERKTGSVVLMGDSIGCMYGKTMKEICADLDYKLTVISVAAHDPLPASNVMSGKLWLDCLAVVQKEKPDCLVFACKWDYRLRGHFEKMAIAMAALRPCVGKIVLIKQPPILPLNASRAAIREGARPPFFEAPEIKRGRQEANDYLDQFDSGNCSVVDIASHFETAQGDILFLDAQGRQLFHDPYHLSQFGVDLIRSNLTQAVSGSPRTPK